MSGAEHISVSVIHCSDDGYELLAVYLILNMVSELT